MNEIVQKSMHQLGITRNYRGYKQLFIAVLLTIEDEDRLLHITREIYKPTAEILQCRPHSIERNIRTIINRIWRKNRKELLTMAGYSLIAPPAVSELIDIIANHARQRCAITTISE